MKIKIEKEMNLPELIQWAWDNPKLSGNKRFYSNDVGGTEATNFILKGRKQ
ncbi:hypothetical protein VBSAUSMH15_30 [Staphylococcus phage vB_SauS_Mh15]|nr:hypothetical protein VBSAUSMH15_30 [Staphylococcus phage vB_SauS_Mh15]